MDRICIRGIFYLNFEISNLIRKFATSNFVSMRIISRSTIKKYYEQHPSSKIALEDWADKVCKAEWRSFADIRKTFNSVDSVGNQHYVFNIKGNDFRLVAVIKFTPRFVLIRFIGTHAEYDRIKNIQNI